MTISTGDIIRVAVTGTAPQSAVWQLVYHLVAQGGVSEDETDVIAGLIDHFETAYTAIESVIADTYTADSLTAWVRNVANHQWDGIGLDVLSGLQGTHVNDPEAHGVAVVFRFLTQALRRQARKFIPGISETLVDEGVLDPTALTALGNFATAFATEVSLVSGDLELCTYNVDETSALYETESAFTGDVLLNDLPGYQRRRKPLVGI